MLFKYQAINKDGQPEQGDIEAINLEVAISSLQRRGFTLSKIAPAESGSFFAKDLSFFNRASNKDIVMLSRQMSTFFEAQVSALRVFRLLAAESEKPVLRKTLTEVADDLQGGSSMTKALARHPNVFSEFYVSMVRAGEESGKLDQTLSYLADYLDRSYEVTSKAKNAMIYPAFVVVVFIGVMVLMLTKIIPSITQILKDSGQEIPISTKAVIFISDFLVNYGLFFLLAIIAGAALLWRMTRTPNGRLALSKFKLKIPYLGNLYKKLYLSRIADNLNTMLASAIPIVKALEITSSVVGDEVYRSILYEVTDSVKGGSTLSDAMGRYPEIPSIMVQMSKVGEESGELGTILKTLAKFYQREVSNAVDVMIGLIEPAMIIALAVGVGILLTSVLMPIYDIAGGIN
ncbi:MAG: type II secretion system F family protein [Candidatus Paceibacterota bacterium]|jgi:type IV pilus assembly protein PilC